MEDLFKNKNGFELIDNSFLKTKQELIKRTDQNNYFYDLFVYKNLFYVIPIHKKIIIEQSEFFSEFISEDDPVVYDSLISISCNGNIIENCFDPLLFTSIVIKILEYIKDHESDKEYSKELLSFDQKTQNLTTEEKNLVLGITKSIERLDVLACTLEAVFIFFDKLDIKFRAPLYIIGKIFSNIGLTEEFIIKFYKYELGLRVESEDIEKNFLPDPDPQDIKLISSNNILTSQINLNDAINDYVLEIPVTYDSNVKFLNFAFRFLHINLSKHILIKRVNSDPYLSVYSEGYFIINDKYCYSLIVPESIPGTSGKRIEKVEFWGCSFIPEFFHRNIVPKAIFYNTPKTLKPSHRTSRNFSGIPGKNIDEYEKGYKNFGEFFLDIEFSDDLVEISDVFMEFSIINKITLPDTIKIINGYFMSGCKYLKKITLPKFLTKIGVAFMRGCKSIKKINLPDTLTTIGDKFMTNCTNLEELILPNSVTSIGQGFLAACKNLQTITLSQSLTSLSGYFMNECINLREITIPNSVKIIDPDFMSGCRKLEKIILPDRIQVITEVFMRECTSLEEITIPETVTTIGDYFMVNCRSLKKITLSQSLTTIGRYFMHDNASIEEITLPDSVTKIDDYFMAYCRNLKKITLPKSLKTIGDNFMDNCENLEEIFFKNLDIKIGNNFLSHCPNIKKIFVPIKDKESNLLNLGTIIYY